MMLNFDRVSVIRIFPEGHSFLELAAPSINAYLTLLRKPALAASNWVSSKSY
jgi:hypothetical protein